MEIADIFVINKADREGAGKLYKETLNMVNMAKDTHSGSGGWKIPVLMVETVLEPIKFAESVEVLSDKIDEHYHYLIDNKLLSERMRRKTTAELNEALWATILQPILNDLNAAGEMNKMIDQLLAKETNPYSLAAEVARRYMK